MDEFNRERNSFDEYAPIEQNTTPPPVFQENEMVNTTQTPDKITDTETVDIDTADDEDTFEAFDKAVSETPVSAPPVNSQPVYNAYNTNQQSNPQYTQQYTPVRPAVNQYQQPVYSQQNQNTNHSNNSNQGYPVNQYNQSQMYNPQYRPMQSHNTQPQQYTQPQQMPNQEPVRTPQQGAVPPAYPAQNSPYAQRPVQNPAQNPYAQYQNPYNTQPPVAKPKTPTGTKVLIGILIGLLVLFMVGFFASCAMYTFTDTDAPVSDNPLSGYATEPPLREFYGYDESSPFSPYFNSNSYEGDYFDEKITLMADEGETQDKGEDKTNTYDPDKNAKGVEFKDIPKDKDDKKYTSQSAYNAVADSVVSVVCYKDKITDNINDIEGEGTGTVISSDGYIVTNSHVIGDSKAYKINIVFNNSDEYEAKIVGYDTRTDLAVLKIDAKNLSYTKFSDSSKVEVGQDVVAIGNPGGSSFQNSLTKGIVSAVERELDLGANVDYIQIDAAINPGNSGGPLCNLYGQVIGINTAKISADAYEGMGFAIPSNKVAQIANDLIHYGYVKDRVRIGIMGQEVNREMKYSYNVPDGVLITEISEDGPLYDTDIKEFDIITAIDGVEISSFQELFAVLEEHKPGDKIELTLYRLES